MKDIFLCTIFLIVHLLNISEIQAQQKDKSCDGSQFLLNISFSYDGKRIGFINNSTQKIHLINLESLRKTETTIGNGIIDFDFSPDGNHLISSNLGTKTLDYWNLNGIKQYSFQTKINSVLVRFLNANKLTTLTFGIVNTYDINGQLLSSKNLAVDQSEQPFVSATKFNYRVIAETLSLVRKLAALVLVNGDVQIWNTNGILVHEFKDVIDHEKLKDLLRPVLVFSPDGNYLVSATRNGNLNGKLNGGRLKLLNLNNYTSMDLETLKGSTAVKFSPDSQSLLVGGADNTLKLWNLNHDLIRSYPDVTATVSFIDISKDGKFIAATTVDGKVHVWEIEGKKVLTSQEVKCGKP